MRPAIARAVGSIFTNSEVTGLVRERAGGNPFFAEELAYALRDSGALAVEDGVCTLRADLEALRDSVPDTVEGVVLSRIDRLSPEKQLTLKVAAVIGRSFLYHTLRDVHPQQVVEDLLRAHLDDLARRDLTPLEALEPELSYLFKHVITQQVAYDTLLFAQRRELHRAVAGWYERVYAANLSPYYPLLVHHWHQAEDTVQERHYAKLAGEQAAAQYANAEAVTYLSRALDLTPETDYAERYTLLLAREKVRSLQGAREDQAQDLADLERLTVALDDNRKRAEVALRQAAHALVTADYPAAITTAQVAIALAQAAQDVNSQAAGYRQWGKALWYQGDYKAARDHLEQALQRYRETGDRWGESASLVILGVFSWSEGDYVGARGSHERALHLFREIGDRQGEAMSLTNLGLVSWNQGKYAEAEAYYEQVLRTCHEMGDLYNLGLALNNLGVITADQGGYASAQAYYEQALHICRVTGDRHTESLTLSNLGCICDYLGDYASARSFHEQSLHICRDIGDRRGEGIALAISGLLFHHLDDDKTAHNYCQHALLVLRELGNRRLQGQAQTYLGHALASLGYLTEAATAYQQALELLREIGEHNLATEPLAGLARVSMAQGDLPQAQAQIEEILKHLESNTLAGTEEPFLVYLTCCRVLQAGRDPRAEEVLVTAYRLLQERAARITDEKLRHSFLENVAAHRELIAAYQARQAAGETG
jgi:tetratricopeptide (TPR) repeat protein